MQDLLFVDELLTDADEPAPLLYKLSFRPRLPSHSARVSHQSPVMHIILLICTAAVVSAGLSMQINYYSDLACTNYIGNRVVEYQYNGGNHNQGGPYGSKGGMFITPCDQSNGGLSGGCGINGELFDARF